MKVKAIHWAGTSYKDVCRFPVGVRKEAGYQLHRVQSGLEPNDWKSMATIGAGVREIRLHAGGAYRVIYLARFEEEIYVLHAFEKKTQQTRQQDIELARSRLKEVEMKRRER